MIIKKGTVASDKIESHSLLGLFCKNILLPIRYVSFQTKWQHPCNGLNIDFAIRYFYV